jgi:type VI secretion system protein ImpC
MASDTTTQLSIKSFISSVRLKAEKPEVEKPTPMLQAQLETIVDHVTDEERFISSLAAVVYNLDENEKRFDKQSIQDLVKNIDKLVDAQLNEILHAPALQELESVWTSIADLVKETNFRANIQLALLDVT